MIDLVIALVITAHGLIHLLGFVKAFDLAQVEQLTLPISRTNGILWLIGTLLLVAAGLGYYLKWELWWLEVLGSLCHNTLSSQVGTMPSLAPYSTSSFSS